MPHIKFTDSNLKPLSADKTTWFTDPTCRGLRLCVTKGGAKTWWVNKWDPTTQKTRSVKLGQWASKVTHCKWAKGQVGKIAHDITEGRVLSRLEQEAAWARLGIPTFAHALEQYITHRTQPRASGKAQMKPGTAYDCGHGVFLVVGGAPDAMNLLWLAHYQFPMPAGVVAGLAVKSHAASFSEFVAYLFYPG